ncbi:MAG: ABC transporter substrate-binding protein [Acidimicrobiia bacterium]|nr:ABC transporter substrate-binding protein [Acidimicrobiia bacterium]
MSRRNKPFGRSARMRWFTIVAVMTLLMAACSSESTDDTTTTSAATDTTVPSAEAATLDDWMAADLSACAEAPTGEPFLIGYAADLSEVGGFADGPGSEGAKYMAELITCAGGIGGHPVEVIVQDIQGDPDVTQRAASDLLDAGVQAILGPPFADFGLPLLQVVGGKVPVIFVASTEPSLADENALSFLGTFDDPRQATEAALFARSQGDETAVTFSIPGPYFGYNPATFTAVFEAEGGTVLGDYTFSMEDSDFSTQVNAISALDAPPDVLYTAMLTPQLGVLIPQMKAAGLTPTYVFADAADATRVWDLGADAEGVYFTTHAFPSPDNRMQEFLDKFEADTGAPLETFSFGSLAADAVILMADAFARTGYELDGVAIGNALKEASNVTVITGRVSYAGSNGVQQKPLYIVQVKNGEVVLVEVVDAP